MTLLLAHETEGPEATTSAQHSETTSSSQPETTGTLTVAVTHAADYLITFAVKPA